MKKLIFIIAECILEIVVFYTFIASLVIGAVLGFNLPMFGMLVLLPTIIGVAMMRIPRRLYKSELSVTLNKVQLDDGAIMPTRAHEWDAGLDLYARETQVIPARESATFDTGVHIEIQPGCVGMLKSKSGLNVNHGLIGEGVIDAGYTGSIKVKLYNLSSYDYVVSAGDKISQLVVMPIRSPELTLVDSLDETQRGDGGFGSTGR